MGAVQRLEAIAASEEPPLWTNKLFGELVEKVTSLETEIQKIKVTCASKHSNSQLKLPLI